MVRKRRRHTAAYKFRVALEAVHDGKAIGGLANDHTFRAKRRNQGAHPDQTRPHPSGCTLFFLSRDLLTGPNHTKPATPPPSDFHSASERLSP